MKPQQYRIFVEALYGDKFLVSLSKVNIDPRGYSVADFEGRSLPALIAKASAWITNDVTHPEPWCRGCDRPQDDCGCDCPQCGSISVPLAEHTCPYKLSSAGEPGGR